jgi:hypothetical protein
MMFLFEVTMIILNDSKKPSFGMMFAITYWSWMFKNVKITRPFQAV